MDTNHNQNYTPYGSSNTSTTSGNSSFGFNGQWKDPVTGWYHLGHGYRVYNPVLMRFHSPDQWAPFISGEVNAYAYCSNDPINRIDPSDHFSIFGWEISTRDLTLAIVGIAVGVVVGILTGGAGFAVEVGVGIAVGVAFDVATGAVYDWASGGKPTWESIGTDALYGAIGGVVGEGLARGIGAGVKGISRALKSARSTLHQLLEGADKLRIAERKRTLPSARTKKVTGDELKVETLRKKNTSERDLPLDEKRSWTVDDSKLKYTRGYEEEFPVYTKFKHELLENRQDVTTAAELAGRTHLKQLNRMEWQIRLNGSDRLLFSVNKEDRIIKMLQIGGHT